MQKVTIPRQETGLFSAISNQLELDQTKFKELITAPFSQKELEQQSNRKLQSFSKEQRILITGVFDQQMKDYGNEAVKKNLKLLKEENSVTITTGHQLNLYTGPLYVVYKIMHIIKLAEEMNAFDAAHNYVPIFWMGTEDHDFPEINHLHLFNDTVIWESEQKGPVGRFNLQDFSKAKQDVLNKFENNTSFASFLEEHYKNETLSEATRRFVMELFEDYGLLILDSDDKQLKASFSDIMRNELTDQFSEKAVNQNSKLLEELGYECQATARPINLFYITDYSRDRIIPIEGGFEIGEKSYTQEEILQFLEQHPERFSPNVVLRPIYQEFILPNICYVGGGGEMSYWLQFKGVFDHLKLPYPMLKVRNSLQLIDGIALKKMKKLNISIPHLFEGIHKVKKQYVLNHEDDVMDFSLLEEKSKVLAEEIESLIIAVDQGLKGYGKSECTKLNKQIDGIKQKLIRHQKKKHEDAMNQIENLFERLFPADGPQERYDNVIPNLAKYGKKEFMALLHDNMEPFGNEYILLVEE
jgi:bacillithiol biosynthesis cysteine-adding enzyme BshC